MNAVLPGHGAQGEPATPPLKGHETPWQRLDLVRTFTVEPGSKPRLRIDVHAGVDAIWLQQSGNLIGFETAQLEALLIAIFAARDAVARDAVARDAGVYNSTEGNS